MKNSEMVGRVMANPLQEHGKAEELSNDPDKLGECEMLWRIAPVTLLPLVVTNPVAIAAAAGYIYSRKNSRTVEQAPNKPYVDFIGGPEGVERVDPVAASLLMAAKPAVIASPTVILAASAISAFATVANATTEVADAVGNTAREAVTRAGDAVSDVTSRVKRQFTNEEANARLRADLALKMEMLEEMERLKDTTAYFTRMRAMFAVGVAIAAADGEISDAERESIQEYVGGASHAALPANLVGALQTWLACPPSLEEAFDLALKCGIGNMPFFDNVIEVAIGADVEIHPAEIEFRARWQELLEEARA